ncbi:MAG: EamA family transporter [Pseudomonadota bacterium]
MPSYLIVVIAVFCIALGQILIKYTATRIEGRELADVIVDWRTMFIFAVAMTIYFGASILWVLALRELPLSRAYMFLSLSFVIVPTAAMLLFGEQLSKTFFLGVVLILAGLVLTQSGNS